MKKTLAILLSVLLTFSCFSLLGTSTALAEQSKGDVLFTSDFLADSSNTRWNASVKFFETQDEDGDDVKDYVRLNASETTSKVQLASPAVDVIPGNSYELSMLVRVPEGSDEFNYTNQFAPNIVLYQPDTKTNGAVSTFWSEGQNEYAYSYESENTKTRRTDFTSQLQIGDNAPLTKNQYSVYDYTCFYPAVGGQDKKLNEELSDWTKLTISFTALASDENDGAQTVAFSFGFKKKGTFSYDLKDIVFKCTDAPEGPKVKTIMKSDFANNAPNWNAKGFSPSFEEEDGEKFITIPAKNQPRLISAPFDLVPGNEYELTFEARVPSTCSTFISGGQAYGPHFSIFEAAVDSSTGKVTNIPDITAGDATKNNVYAFNNIRRDDISVTWEIEGQDAYTDSGNTLFDTSDQRNITGTQDPKEVYSDWTTIKVKFTAVQSAANSGAQKAAVAFGCSFSVDNRSISIKNVSLVETAQGGSTEPEEPVEPEVTIRGPEVNESFEDYNAGDKLFDGSSTAATQDFYVYKSEKNGELQTWANLSIASGNGFGHTGTKSLTGSTYYQFAAMPVNLQPNTDYNLSFWYAYTTNDPDIYLNEITYGLYKTDPTAKTIEKATGVGIFETKKVYAPTNALSGVWKKATLSFKTGDDTDGLAFMYTYNDRSISNPDKTDVNKIPLYIDDIVIQYAENTPAKSNITLSSKDAASVEVISGYVGDFNLGDKVQFKVRTKDSITPVVTVNGTAVEPSAKGIYSFIATENDVIDVVCDGDENRRDAGTDKNGNDLTKYNEELATIPVWEGNTVYHETAAFCKDRDTIKLLYPISEVISVRSYDLTVNYLEGVDYEITEDGAIKILDGSKIPVYERSLTSSQVNRFPVVGEEGSYVSVIDDYTYPAYAINVTYEHTTQWEDGYTPYKIESAMKDIPNVFEKLQNGEEVNIVIYGDSASCGWSSSGLNYINQIYDGYGNLVNNALNIPPYTPTWMEMLESNLKKLYPNATINFKNIALGGTKSDWGYKKLAERLALLGDDWTTDLMILAFGGNDLTEGVTPEALNENMQKIIDGLRDPNTKGGNPDAEILLWSQYICNTDAIPYTIDKHLAYQAEYKKLAEANDGVALVDTVQEFYEIVKTKETMDIFNTNLNHGNDFLTRVIAQCMIKGLSLPEFVKGDIDNDETSNLKDLVTLARFAADWDVTVNEYAADVNGDGITNLADVTALARYLAGWKD